MKVRLLLTLATLTLASAAALAQQPTDEAAVRAVIASEIQGWDKYDAHQVASAFAPECLWQNPFGVRLHSRAELEAFLQRLFKRPSYLAGKDTSAAKITDLRLTSPTTAVVWSEESSEGQLDQATGKPFSRHSHYIELLTKINGQWLITDSMIMDELPHG